MAISADVLRSYRSIDEKVVDKLLAQEIKNNNKKIVVLDDDPTGVQGIDADGSTAGFVVTDGKILFNGSCGRVVLYNAQGAAVRSLDNPTVIDLGSMPRGVYIVNFNGTSTKFVH